MILKGNQRGGAYDLATHLLKDENEHVEVHEIRGFIADDLHGAFKEAQAIAKGTKCQQFLFSLSLNPPQTENVSTPAFERAADEAEKRLGLEDQPRAIVFHEKEGRRHAHVVWSRIDAHSMTAINLSHYKRKLTKLSKELYLEHGWELPKGLKDPSLKDPLNFTLEEWQQALRSGRDPREIKQVFQDAWKHSDSLKALNAALNEKGFMLAKGDRRGFVAVDYVGDVYALAKWTGVKAKEVKQLLGKPDDLPTVDEARQHFRDKITPNLKNLMLEQKQRHATERQPLKQAKADMAQQHKQARQTLARQQQKRWQHETQKRQSRLSKGLKGVWERLSGHAAKVKQHNEFEAWDAAKRDQMQRDNLILHQLDTRRDLQKDVIKLKQSQRKDRLSLSRLIGNALKVEGRKALDQARMRGLLHRSKQRDGPGLER